MRLVRIAHRLRSGGQDIPEHRLTVGGTAFGRLTRPASAGLEIRRRCRGGGEQPGGQSGIRTRGQPMDRKGGKLRLRLHIALVGRPLEPARTFRQARRHAGTFQITAAHTVFGLRDAGTRGAAQQREGLLGIPLFDQPHRPAQRGGGRERDGQAVEKSHRPYRSPARETVVSGGLTARASLRRQPEGPAPAGIAGLSAGRP